MKLFPDITLIMISGDTTATTTTYEGVPDIIIYHHIIIE